MQNSSLKYSIQSENERVLNTTIPRDLIRLLKILAKTKEVRVNHIVVEAIQDLLIKYKNLHMNNNEN